MELQDLDRIRFVTRHFNELRGLATDAPVGLALWAFGFVLLGAVPMSLRYTLSALTLGAAFLLGWQASAHYRARFGEVEPQAAAGGAGAGYGLGDLLVDFGRGVVRDIVGASAFDARYGKVEARPSATPSARPRRVGSGWIMAFTIAGLSVHDIYGSRGEILYFYLVISALLLKEWASLGRSRLTAHYPVLAMLLLGLAVASRSSVLVIPFMASDYAAALMFFGCLLVLLGLLNHRLLARTLAALPPRELQTTPEAAGQRR